MAADCLALAAACLPLGLSAWAVVLLAGLVLSLNAAGGHYQARLAPSLLDDLPGLLCRALAAGGLVTLAGVAIGLPASSRPLLAATLFVGLASASRALGLTLARAQRTRQRQGRPTVIVGCGRVGNQIGRALLAHPEYGLTPIGYVDDDAPGQHQTVPAPLLGDIASLENVLAQRGVRHLIVAFGRYGESDLRPVLAACSRLSCEIFFVPRFFELQARGLKTDFVWGIPLARVHTPADQRLTWPLKRLVDVALAGLALILLAPVLVVCAIAVRLEGGPGVLFRQVRVGRGGRPFSMLKFRSLRPQSDQESAECWNVATDPRLGPVGRLLRQLSLDELPQLWNVLRGDMSLVGPRPERPYFVDRFSQQYPGYESRHRLPVGITGWSQIHGLRGDTDIGDRATFDNYYIENWTLWGDVKIMLSTLGQVVRGAGR